ncbi:hypothetical protein ACFC1R_20810 [Kitasatospora sp. NPDC056138]|uniref:hypothetical protein n=1 Tax=Kitasatospora sp. NPDC056138 TaxID=3345724 RepID=UPI0035E0C1D5
MTPATTGSPTAAALESTAHDFKAWAATRVPWRDRPTVTGDHGVADRFLDALNLV